MNLNGAQRLDSSHLNSARPQAYLRERAFPDLLMQMRTLPFLILAALAAPTLFAHDGANSAHADALPGLNRSETGVDRAHASVDRVRLHPDTLETFEEERQRMVRRQIAARGIEDAAVLDAMRSVPRHQYVPEGLRDEAYADRPLPIGHGQTISQPYIVAYMTELADVDADDRVLEVGTGSGYQAAVLAQIVDHVYTIEIVGPLASSANSRLNELGYDNVSVKNADGYYGWPEHGPFDAIVVTAASEHIPPPLIEQLRDGGRMVIPVGTPFRTQMLMLVTKEDGEIKTRSLAPVRFVPFRRAN